MAIRHSITLSTSEPNNEVGNLKIRQGDEQTQTLVANITENGVPKPFTGLQPFFCAKLGQTAGLGIIEQKVTGAMNPANGTLEYVMQPEDWQQLGRQTAYFSFRKMVNDHEWTEQFSTRDFNYNVTKSVFSEGLREVKKDGSTYVWTIEDMLRLFKEYMATGKIDWENYKNDERTIWETYRLAEKINWDDYKLREKNEWQNYKADEKTTWENFVEDNREFLENADPGGKITLELLGARGEAQTLGERLDSEKAEVSAQLADMTNNEIGIKTGLPSWLQENLRKVSKMHDDYLREIGINIKQPPYNAKGDGVSDDTLAIQQALNATPAGKAIIIPRGDYIITNTLLIDKPVTILGNNVGAEGYTVLRANLTGKEEGTPVIKITKDGSSSRLSDIYVRNTLATKTHDGISTGGADGYVTHMSFNNVWVVGFKNNYYLPKIYLSRFRDCYAVGGGNGFNMAGFSTSLVFEGCYANHNTSVGYLLDDIVYSSFISCAADNNGTGYRITNCRGVKLSACGAEVSSNTAFYLAGNEGVSIDSPFGINNGIETGNPNASFIMVENDNESISIDNPIEETTGAGDRSYSIIFGYNATGSINNPKTVMGYYYGNKVSYNGQFFGLSKPTNEGHYQGKVVWNKTPREANVNNYAGWICVNNTAPFDWAGLGVINYPI